MLAAARRAARPARFPGNKRQPRTPQREPAAEPGTGAAGRTPPNYLTFYRCFSACSRFMIPCQVTGGIIRQETVEGQKGALNRPTVSPGEVSGIETAGAAIWRITARASGSGGAAFRPCASSRVIYMPVTQTRLTSARRPTKRLFAAARPHLPFNAR